jgi:hypothetical protein
MLMTQLVTCFTYEGEVYCPECVAYTNPVITGESATDTRVDMPAAVFSYDDVPVDWICIVCESSIH